MCQDVGVQVLNGASLGPTSVELLQRASAVVLAHVAALTTHLRTRRVLLNPSLWRPLLREHLFSADAEGCRSSLFTKAWSPEDLYRSHVGYLPRDVHPQLEVCSGGTTLDARP